ncbi:unnamed protein product [Schistosoma margrebowiei]|uniref:Uncharacterized protein n=1 Tax=Schistosoma margrebowiei TaxID=48269 RepID=A0A183LI10_9TREM|nr:unnamed protein product [Schistosoma margrebowiei]
MKNFTAEGKHRIRWTAWRQLDDSDFSNTSTNAGQNKQCSSKFFLSRSQHAQGKKQHPQIQHGEHQPNHNRWRNSGRGGIFHEPEKHHQ